MSLPISVTDNAPVRPATTEPMVFTANTTFLFTPTGAANTYPVLGEVLIVSGAFSYVLPTDAANTVRYRGTELTARAIAGAQSWCYPTTATVLATLAVGDEATFRWTGTTWVLINASPGAAVSTTRLAPVTTLTEVSGAITLVSNNHKVAGEGAAADDLDTLSGIALTAGNWGYLRASSGSVVITIRDTGGGTGNIRTPGQKSIALASTTDWALWVSDGTNCAIVAFRTAGYLPTSSTVDKADTAPTLTAAEVAGGQVTGTPTVTRAYTFPTAAQLVAAFPGSVVGSTHRFWVINLAVVATRTITFVMGAGCTAVGNMVLEAASSGFTGAASFNIRFTNVTSGAETVVITRAS